MANRLLQGLLCEPKHRLTDRAAFAQAVSRLSSFRAKKEQEEQKSEKDARKPAA